MMRPPLTTPFRIGRVKIPNRVLLAPLAGIGNWFVRLQARRLPVIVSGGLCTAERARRAYVESEADAVMVARGSLGNPWIFEELTGRRLAPPAYDEVVGELLWVIDTAGEHFGGRAPSTCAGSIPGTCSGSGCRVERTSPSSARGPSTRPARLPGASRPPPSPHDARRPAPPSGASRAPRARHAPSSSRRHSGARSGHRYNLAPLPERRARFG